MPTAPVDEDAKQAAAQAALEEAKEGLHVGKGVDPLDALLAMEQRAETLRESFPITLMSGQTVEFTVRPLTGREIDKIQDRCTRWVRQGRGPKVKELDTQEMNALLVATATQNPDFSDPRLKQKFGTTHPEETVQRALLPGSIDGLASKILEVSGYTDDLVGLGKP